MEVKEGYKKTEVGVIPEDWEVKRIGDLTTLKNGYAFSSAFFSKTGPIVITPGNFNLSGGLKFNQKNTLRYSGEVKSEMKFSNGDLIIVMTDLTPTCDLLGKPGIINSDEVILHNQRIGKISIISNLLLKGYLFRFFTSEMFSRRMKETATGSTVRHTSVGSINNTIIHLPPLQEQNAIATVLSDTDNLIQALEKKIAKKELIKKGARQQLLEPKEGWEVIRIDDAIDVYRGGSPRPIQDYITNLPFGVNWIKIGDTSSVGKYITQTKERIIPEGALYSRSVSKGDFLLSNSMSFGRPYILKIDGCIHDGWLVLQNYQATFDREFLYYTLTSEDVLNQYLSKASGSGVLNLNKELVKTVELNRPKDVAEQTRIAQILSDMDNEIELLQEKLSKYKQVKQGLMQELLTGRIRLV